MGAGMTVAVTTAFYRRVHARINSNENACGGGLIAMHATTDETQNGVSIINWPPLLRAFPVNRTEVFARWDECAFGAMNFTGCRAFNVTNRMADYSEIRSRQMAELFAKEQGER